MTVKGKIFLCVAVLAVLFAVAGSVVLGRYYVDNRKANFTSDYVLYVYPDTELDEVVDSLQSGAGTIGLRVSSVPLPRWRLLKTSSLEDMSSSHLLLVSMWPVCWFSAGRLRRI